MKRVLIAIKKMQGTRPSAVNLTAVVAMLAARLATPDVDLLPLAEFIVGALAGVVLDPEELSGD